MRRLPSGWQRNWHLVNFLASMNFVRHLHFLSPLAAQVVRGQPGQGRRGVAQRRATAWRLARRGGAWDCFLSWHICLLFYFQLHTCLSTYLTNYDDLSVYLLIYQRIYSFIQLPPHSFIHDGDDDFGLSEILFQSIFIFGIILIFSLHNHLEFILGVQC